MSEKVMMLVGMGPGVGMATAKRFGREGYKIGMAARSSAKLDQYERELKEAGVEACAFVADAASFPALESAYRGIKERFGAPDVVHYNAAALTQAAPSKLDPEQLVEEFRVNAAGALASAQLALPDMTEAGKGSILFTSGGFANNPMPRFASLGVGKAAILNLAKSLHDELKPKGVHVGAVTINGFVKPGTSLDPANIAEKFWELHQQPKDQFEKEIQIS